MPHPVSSSAGQDTEFPSPPDISSHMAAIVESSDDAIISKTLKGIITTWNNAAEIMFGYKASEAIGRSISMLIPLDRIDEEPKIIEKLKRGERIHHYETVRQRKDGTLLDVSLTVSPVKNTQGIIVGASKIIRDITERKRTDQALFESNQRLQALMNALPVGVSFSDDASCEHITGNPAVMAQFDLSPWENLSASAPDVNAPGRKVRFFSEGRPITDAELPLQKAVNENRLVPPMELEVHLPNGRRWFVSASGSPIHNAEGKVISGVSVTVDITEHKLAEEILRREARTTADRREELEKVVNERTVSLREAVAQMEEFSYSVSHDLRAPLRAMQGYAAAILDDYGSQLPPNGQEYLQRIIRAGLRMDQLIRDVLTYSKIPREMICVVNVSLDKLVSEIILLYGEEAAAEIIVKKPLLSVRAHEPLLVQALSNLIDNAIKFTAPEKKQQVRIWTESHEGRIRLWVEDNGIGISPEYQDRIWGMFERVHPHGPHEGTGIGLAIVRKSLERMGGAVGLKSDGKTGSQFWIELPKAD